MLVQCGLGLAHKLSGCLNVLLTLSRALRWH